MIKSFEKFKQYINCTFEVIKQKNKSSTAHAFSSRLLNMSNERIIISFEISPSHKKAQNYYPLRTRVCIRWPRGPTNFVYYFNVRMY